MRYFVARQTVTINDLDKPVHMQTGDVLTVSGEHKDWLPPSQLIECEVPEKATRISKHLLDKGPFPETWEYPNGLWI